MSVSRTFGLFKNLRNAVKVNNQVRQINWMGHDDPWRYRSLSASHVPKECFLIGDAVLGFAIWWILWHFWHEPGHVFGEFPYPDPSKWTDAELGVPPDDEE